MLFLSGDKALNTARMSLPSSAPSTLLAVYSKTSSQAAIKLGSYCKRCCLLLTSTAPGHFIQDIVASTERPKPPLASLQKVESALEREISQLSSWRMPAPSPHSVGCKDDNEVSRAGGIDSRTEMKSNLAIMRKAREQHLTSSICFLCHLDGGREIAYSGVHKWKLDMGPGWIVWDGEATESVVAWAIVIGSWSSQLPSSLSASFPPKKLQPPDRSHWGTCLKFSMINSWHLSFFHLNFRREAKLRAHPTSLAKAPWSPHGWCLLLCLTQTCPLSPAWVHVGCQVWGRHGESGGLSNEKTWGQILAPPFDSSITLKHFISLRPNFLFCNLGVIMPAWWGHWAD